MTIERQPVENGPPFTKKMDISSGSRISHVKFRVSGHQTQQTGHGSKRCHKGPAAQPEPSPSTREKSRYFHLTKHPSVHVDLSSFHHRDVHCFHRCSVGHDAPENSQSANDLRLQES